MNSCVVSGPIREAEDWQISGYMNGPNKEKGRVVPEVSNSRVPELIESAVSAHHIAKCHSSGSDKLNQSISVTTNVKFI
jgi:hypothetical protein